MIPRIIFGPKRVGGLTGGCRKFRNEEFCNLYFSSNKIRLECVVNTRSMRKSYRIWVGKPEKTLRKHSRGWKNNIKMDLIEIGWESNGLDLSGPE
jgi:hypothetical protein